MRRKHPTYKAIHGMCGSGSSEHFRPRDTRHESENHPEQEGEKREDELGPEVKPLYGRENGFGDGTYTEGKPVGKEAQEKGLPGKEDF